jgi:hypothetical protein
MLIGVAASLSVLMLGGTFVWFLNQLRLPRRPTYGTAQRSVGIESGAEESLKSDAIEALLERTDQLAERSRSLAEKALANMEWGQTDITIKIPLGTPKQEIEHLFLTSLTEPEAHWKLGPQKKRAEERPSAALEPNQPF